MRFSKTNEIYKVIRVTGSQDNILGISFVEIDNIQDNIEVIEWEFPKMDKSQIQTSKEEVLKQVISGLASVNRSLGTNYKLSKIYFSPFDMSTNRIYSGLIAVLIRHYHCGNEFKKV